MALDGDALVYFGWSHCHLWAIFVLESNSVYTWSDPNYPGGSNTITKYNGTYKQWCRQYLGGTEPRYYSTKPECLNTRVDMLTVSFV